MGKRLFAWILGLWMFLQGVATIWPVVNKATIPEWIATQSWLSMSGTTLLGWASLLVGCVVMAMLIIERIFPRNAPTAEVNWDKYPQETINRRTYTNEMVEIDGKTFNHCKFINATLMFHGRAPFTMVNSDYTGSIHFVTDHPAARDALSFANSLRESMRLQAFGGEFFIGEKNKTTGQIVIISKDTFVPPKP